MSFGSINTKSEVDINLPSTTSFKGRFFEVAHSPGDNNFYIRDFGEGNGTYIKLQTEWRITDSCLISLGNSFIIAEEINSTSGKLANFSNYIKQSSNSKLLLLDDQSLRLTIYNTEYNKSSL